MTECQDLPLIDEVALADVFVSAIGKIERLTGNLVRITYYSERHNSAGEMEHVVALKMIRPIATWPQAMRMIARILGEADMPFIAEGGKVRAMN